MTAVLLLVFVSASLISYAVLSTVFNEERRVVKVMRSLPEYEARQLLDAQPMLRPFPRRVLGPLWKSFERGIERFSPTGSLSRTRARLLSAGIPAGLDPYGFIALKVLSATLVGVVFGGIMGNARGLLVGVLCWAIGTVLGTFIPDLWLTNTIDHRKQKIRRELPEMLDMLTISVQAGLGLDAAMAKLVQNTSGPLSEEFGRMLQEVQAGSSRSEALRHLADRADVPELRSFVTALIQADVFGVTVSSVLSTQSRELRLRRKQAAEEAAQKMPVKVVFPVVVFILPASLIVVGGPAVVAIARAFGMID